MVAVLDLVDALDWETLAGPPECVNGDDRPALALVRLRCCPESAYLCAPCLTDLRRFIAKARPTARIRCELCGHRWPPGSGLDDIADIQAVG